MRSRRRALLLALVAVAGLLVGWAAPAVAQDGERIQGTLRYKDAANEDVFVEGVDVVVLDPSGTEVGRATSGPDGTFAVDVPGPGDYSARIEIETLPAGITLRNPDRQQLDNLSLTEGQSRNVIFALENTGGVAAGGDGGDDGATATPAPRPTERRADSNWDRAARLSVDGLKFGLIIAMSAIGLSLIFGTTGLVNFAHGELVAFGALIAFLFNVTIGLPLFVAGVIGIVATAGFGYTQDRFFWRPLRNRKVGLIAMLVVSIGLSILVRYLYLYQFGGRRRRYDQFALQTDGLEIGPVTIVPREIWIIVISIVVLLSVALAVQRTRIGKAMRAVSDNRDLAESSGIDVERVILSIWIAGGALAGLGGVLFGADQGVSWNMGFELLLLMFAAVTLGGLGTAYGPLVGALVVGMLIQVSTIWIAPELKNVGALAILVGILLIRPQGIFGQSERIG